MLISGLLTHGSPQMDSPGNLNLFGLVLLSLKKVAVASCCNSCMIMHITNLVLHLPTVIPIALYASGASHA